MIIEIDVDTTVKLDEVDEADMLLALEEVVVATPGVEDARATVVVP